MRFFNIFHKQDSKRSLYNINTIREHFDFYGTVQGVGFRFQMQQLALQNHLTGWVKNQYDGSVEAELQGTRKDIDHLIEGLYKDSYIRIDEIKRRTIPVQDDDVFQIQYY